jgi:hypothetical protein
MASVRERLLVYDLWDDPLLERPINEERPDLVEKYSRLLETQVEVNAALRALITGGGQSVELRPEDLEQLRHGLADIGVKPLQWIRLSTHGTGNENRDQQKEKESGALH